MPRNLRTGGYTPDPQLQQVEQLVRERNAARKEVERLIEVHPASEWREGYGDVLWWHFPVCEPPIVGSGAAMGTRDRNGEPTDCRRLQESGWLTHWSRIPVVWNGDGTPLKLVGNTNAEGTL